MKASEFLEMKDIDKDDVYEISEIRGCGGYEEKREYLDLEELLEEFLEENRLLIERELNLEVLTKIKN